MQDIDYDFLLDLFETTPEALTFKQMPDQLGRHMLQNQFALKEKSYVQMYPSGKNCIIEVEGEPVGRLFVNESSDEIRLVDIAICPSFRGYGIGSSLLRKIISTGCEKKIPICLCVGVENIEAQRFYKRHDFIFGESDGVYIYCYYLIE